MLNTLAASHSSSYLDPVVNNIRNRFIKGGLVQSRFVLLSSAMLKVIYRAVQRVTLRSTKTLSGIASTLCWWCCWQLLDDGKIWENMFGDPPMLQGGEAKGNFCRRISHVLSSITMKVYHIDPLQGILTYGIMLFLFCGHVEIISYVSCRQRSSANLRFSGVTRSLQ